MKKIFMLTSIFVLFTFTTFSNPTKDQDAFIKVAEKVMPAVVNINTEKIIKQRYVDPFEELFNDPFFGRRYNSQPKEYKRKATALGSGFLISKDGYIVTNNHVIDQADKIEITFNNKEKYPAEVIGTDSDSDIAVLKIKQNNKEFPFLDLGDSDKLKIGQWAIAIGNPYGLNNTMTVGIVSATGRNGMGIENYEDFIQTDASINPGNSGGPLVDINGNVIGINTAILSKTGGNVGIGFAIPVNMVKTITNSLIENGKFERGWLGIQMQDVDNKMAEKFGLNNSSGVIITKIFDESPADKANLQIGDIILEINETAIDNSFTIRNLIGNMKPNTKIKTKILRNKKEKLISLKLGKREEQIAELNNNEIKILGMKIKTLDDELRKKFGYDNQNGVIILEVDADSEAYSYGIRPGYIIQKVNQTAIKSSQDILEIFNNTKENEDILFFISSKNSNKYVILTK